MNTECSAPAVVRTSDGECLIVIGGYDGHLTATVQLFLIKDRKWYKLTDLPQPLPNPSATIVYGDLVHVVGDDANGYSCSIGALPSSDKPQSRPHLISWTTLPPLPVIHSTAATLCGQLVLIGGVQDRSPVNPIHQLVDGQWVRIGSMASSRSYSLVASSSSDNIIVVGGWGEQCEKQDGVEEYTVLN